jgi:hypothetical protein
MVSFHFGLPEPEVIRALKSAGIFILSSATTVAEARLLERRPYRSSRDSSLEEAGFELFVPLRISASPSWWSRARKPQGAPQRSFSGLLLGLSSITVPWTTLFLSVVLYILVPVIAPQLWRPWRDQ